MLKKSAAAHPGDSLAWLFGAALFLVVSGLSVEAILQAVIHPDSPAQAAAKMRLWPGLAFLMRPEPVKNALYVLLVPLAAAVAALAAWASGRSRSPAALTWAVRVLAVGGGLMIVWWLLRMNWLTILPGAPSPPDEAILAHPFYFALFATLAAAVAAGLAWKNAGRTAMVLALIPPLFLARTILLKNGDVYAETNHFEVFSYPIFQDWLGQGLYVGADGQKSQYGMYPIFLRPLWMLFGPPSVPSISAAMGFLMACSQYAMVGFMARFSVNRVLGVVVAIAAIMTSQLLYTFWPGDPYFQFFPIRLVFPAISMALIAMGIVRRPQQWFALPLLCLGLLWNFESGVVGVAMYVIYILAMEFEPNWRSFFGLIAEKGMRVGVGVGASALALIVYYMVRFHAGPNFALLVDSLKAFSSGMSDVPMPPFGAWGIHCLIYLASGFVAFRTLWSRPDLREKSSAAALLAMTVCGVLWFRYYQGRAEPPNLTTVSAPAVCCLGLLADRALRMSGRERTVSTVLSAVVAAVFIGALAVWGSTNPFAGRNVANLFHHDENARMSTRVGRVLSLFNAVRTGPEDRLLVFAPYAGELNMELQRPGPITASGVCQVFYQSEVDQFVAQARNPATKMFVMDPSYTCGYMRYPELDQAVKQYFVKVQNPTTADISAKRFEGFKDTNNCLPALGCSLDVYVRKGVQVWKPGQNLAQGHPATQISTFGDAKAERAVDGIDDGNWTMASVAHTGLEKRPWWQVDLGANHHIEAIQIWNRADCCGERLSNFWVLVSTRPFLAKDTLKSLRRRPDVFAQHVSASPDPDTLLKIGAVGRYVRVQIDDKNYLALAEVKVFGH